MSQQLNQLAGLYLKALQDKAFDPARLGEFVREDVSFRSAGCEGQGLAGLSSELERIHRHYDEVGPQRVFVEGDEACVIYEMRSSHEGATTLHCADWLHIEGDRISSVLRVHDARPIERLAAEI